MRASVSLANIFGVVPEEIKAWKPDTAPHAMVINKNGNKLPDHTGPLPSSAYLVTAGICISGIKKTIPNAKPIIAPIFKKVER